jgi:hypothetical protein
LLQALVSWAEAFPGPARPKVGGAFSWTSFLYPTQHRLQRGVWINRKSWSGFHGFSSERNFSIHKVPLETYISKLCVYFLIAPSAGFLIQPATMWKTHTPTRSVSEADEAHSKQSKLD